MTTALNNLPIILIGVAIFFIVGGAFFGLMRGFARSFLRFFTVFVAFIGSALGCAFYLQNPERVLSIGKVEALLSKVSLLRTLKTELPEVYEILLSLPVAMLAPLLFLLVFFAVSSVLLVIYGIAAAFIFPKKRDGQHFRPISSTLGAVIGAAQGVLITLAVMVPFVGLATVTVDAVDHVEAQQGKYESAAIEKLKDYREVFIKVENSRVFGYARLLRADKISDSLMKLRLKDESGKLTDISVKDEIMNLAGMYAHAMPLIGRDVKSFGQDQAEAIELLAADFGRSELLTRVTAELLSEACADWKADKSFLGHKPLAAEGEFSEFMRAFYDTFDDSSSATVASDFETIADVFSVLAEHGVFPLLENGEALQEKLAESGVISELAAALNANPRTQALEAALLRLVVKAFCSELLDGVGEELRESYGVLIFDVAAALNDLDPNTTAEEQLTALTEEVRDALDEYGFEAEELSEVLLSEMATQLISGLGDRLGSVSAEDVDAFLRSKEFLPAASK